MPHYYIQNFGTAVSYPDTSEYAGFAQDTIRVSDHFGLTVGLRYDFQSFRTDRLVSNYYYPDSGRVPVDRNNLAPRLGFAYSVGERRPLVVRGGFGMFYTRIPSMYTSQIETDNGDRRTHLMMSAAQQQDRPLFPTYPNPLVSCATTATVCAPPPELLSHSAWPGGCFCAAGGSWNCWWKASTCSTGRTSGLTSPTTDFPTTRRVLSLGM